MKVVINTLSHVTGGGITYFENVLPRLAGDDNEYVVVLPSERDKITRVDAENIRYVETSFPVGSIVGRLFYEQIVFPIFLWFWGVDVLFSPADLTPLLGPCPAVLAIRNPNPYFEVPELERTTYRRVKFRVQKYLTWLSSWKATSVIFVSEFSKEVVNSQLGIPESKTSVVYHGIDRTLFETPDTPDDAALVETIQEQAPYVLCVSTINEHKNYETLLRGYARLSSERREEYPLVIAGRNSAPSYFETLQDILDEEGIGDDVRFLREVDYDHVPSLYEHAALYVLPSKLETFGHTLIEAMASGTPIVAADATCIPEIADGAAELFDPDDPDALSAAMSRVLGDETHRSRLTSAGDRRVDDFSWDRTVSQTRSLFEAACESSKK